MTWARDAGKPVLGLVTIGQSPRDDLVAQMLPLLPHRLEMRQVGALDNLTDKQIAEMAPDPADQVLHTRLRNGSAVTVGQERILALVQAGIRQLEEERANPILLLCTAEFPNLKCNVLLVEPDRLLVNVVAGLRPRKLGVFLPLPSQREAAAIKWRLAEAVTVCVAASPYRGPHEIVQAAAELAADPVDLIVMDCMGYSEAHKRLVIEATGKPVILAIGLVARILGELLGSV